MELFSSLYWCKHVKLYVINIKHYATCFEINIISKILKDNSTVFDSTVWRVKQLAHISTPFWFPSIFKVLHFYDPHKGHIVFYHQHVEELLA